MKQFYLQVGRRFALLSNQYMHLICLLQHCHVNEQALAIVQQCNVLLSRARSSSHIVVLASDVCPFQLKDLSIDETVEA